MKEKGVTAEAKDKMETILARVSCLIFTKLVCNSLIRLYQSLNNPVRTSFGYKLESKWANGTCIKVISKIQK